MRPSGINLKKFCKYLNDNAITAEDYVFWYEKACQIDPSNIYSQYLIAQCTEIGKGVAKNQVDAYKLYEKFGRTGNYLCKYKLALLSTTNRPANHLKSFTLIKSAAENGHSAARRRLAFIYMI
ncbi:5182_t:CDS:2, partial [Ambispora leptoticha]